MPLRTEPRFSHDAEPRIGILLINLGTPASPTPAAVRRYLRQFLSDPRVVEIPRLAWWPILHGLILPLRPARSARKYRAIWTSEGSPLLIYTARQATLLRGHLGEQIEAPVAVEFGMRYGEPSIAAAIARLREAGCDRMLVTPLYPQYAASTTASALDSVCEVLKTTRNVPEVRVIKHFHDHPGYIEALARRLLDFWQREGRPDLLVQSFHGVPRVTLDRGDPYHCECQKTARLLAERLGLAPHAWRIGFQSRFGRAEWLRPYTGEVLNEAVRQGKARVDVICPGFVADCLETLEEIGIEARRDFLAAGGRELRLVPCLNDSDAWMRALAAIVRDHLGGWIPTGWTRAGSRADAADRSKRARAMGASQ